jgi:general secretion pathway protein K
MRPPPVSGRHRRRRAPSDSRAWVGILNRQDGIALVLTLLVVTLLTAMIIDFDYRTRLDVRAAANFRDSAKASLLAQGAVEAARAVLMEDLHTSPAYDYSEEEIWGTRIPGYAVADGTIDVAIEDEGGKLDLNTLVDTNGEAIDSRVELYRRLLELVFNPTEVDIPTLVDSLVDWIDSPTPDDSRPYGAEDSTYERLDPPYECADGPLRTLDELRLVQGYTPEIVEQLRPHVTALWMGRSGKREGRPKDGNINLNDASRKLLHALVHEPEEGGLAQNIEDTRPFTAISGSELEKVIQLGPELSQEVAKETDFASDYFSIVAKGTVGDATRSVRVTVRRLPSEAKVIAWRSE